MARLLRWLLLSLVVGCGTAHVAPAPPAPSPPAPPLERVVIVTVDGLRPVECARYPTFAKLSGGGAFAALPDGALSVFPSVTYPAHTSIATGVHPARHGIVTNYADDPTPEGVNKGGWRWYAEDIRVPTLWDVAREAGLRTALVSWPVTVGARATARLPEYWRAKTGEDYKLLRALSAEGTWGAITARVPDFEQRFDLHDIPDSVVVDAAIAVIAEVKPHVVFMHLLQTDGAQHEFGPDSERANATMVEADRQLGRLVAALEQTKEWPRTVLVVASDHGFARVTQAVVPAAVLAQAGLAARVWSVPSAGSAYFYARDPADRTIAAELRAFFDTYAKDASHGVGRVLGPEEIAAEHGDPRAILAIEGAPGFAVIKRDGAGPVIPFEGGTHGYAPGLPEMRATLLFYGPKVAPTTLRGARLVDVAPTVAPWLGLTLPDRDGTALPIELR